MSLFDPKFVFAPKCIKRPCFVENDISQISHLNCMFPKFTCSECFVTWFSFFGFPKLCCSGACANGDGELWSCCEGTCCGNGFVLLRTLLCTGGNIGG